MTSALEGGEWSAACPGHTLPPGKTRYPLYRRLGGPKGWSGQAWKISPSPGFDPRTVQPILSRYTDWATRPTQPMSTMTKPPHLISNFLIPEAFIFGNILNFLGTALAQWLRYCTTNQKVANSLPDGVIGSFHWRNPSDRTMALGSTQPLTEMSTRSISWG
jgi:hypothetical protein